jgi:group I intron endonuclease
MNTIHNKKYHFIYITTNLTNGKQYVGYRSTNTINDNYLGSGILLKKKIKQYGICNYKRSIIEMCNEFDWKEKEKYWIKEKNTLVPNGYNISEGGDGGNLGKIVNEKLSNKNKGKTYEELYGVKRAQIIKNKISSTEKGKILSEETKKKMSIAKRGFKPSKETTKKQQESRKGYKHSEETKKKMSIANKGNKNLGKNLKNRPKKKCDYCNREIDIANYARYHGEKCKFKE